MGQFTFEYAEYAGKRGKTWRGGFLEEMERVVRWKWLLSLMDPVYPMAGRGRHSYPVLRVHLMQNRSG